MSFDGAQTWVGKVYEDGMFSVLARMVSLDGNGTQVIADEGNCLLPTDVDSITLKVFSLGTNKDNPAGVEVTPAPTLTPSGSLFNALKTIGWPISQDPAGYNFRHDLTPYYVANSNEWYLLEYKFTLTAGGVAWLKALVKTVPIQSN